MPEPASTQSAYSSLQCFEHECPELTTGHCLIHMTNISAYRIKQHFGTTDLSIVPAERYNPLLLEASLGS